MFKDYRTSPKIHSVLFNSCVTDELASTECSCSFIQEKSLNKGDNTPNIQLLLHIKTSFLFMRLGHIATPEDLCNVSGK